MARTPGIEVRDRVDADLGACVELATAVHALDGYPSFLGDGGFEAFLTPPDAIGAWVATRDDAVVGHVLLRPRSAPPSVELAAASLGVDEASLGFVARLVVDPGARRLGIGRTLLDTVVAAARDHGLVPTLDVVVRDGGAIALYEASGWSRLGDVAMTMRAGGTLDLVVFAKP